LDDSAARIVKVRLRTKRRQNQVRFGIFSIFDYWPQVKSVSQYFSDILHLAQRAEELGYDSFWISEHHFTNYGGILPRPQILLAALAQRTRTIRLGSAVSLVPFDSPVRLAEDFGLIDVLSGGRLEFGVGRGLFGFEYDGLGVSQDESRARLEEGVKVVRAAWQSEQLTYHGHFTNVDNLAIHPRPLQKPHPPLYVAAVSPESYDWAAQEGYSILQVLYFAPLERTAEQVGRYRTLLEQSRHDPARAVLVAISPTHVATTSERAKCEAAEPLTNYVGMVSALLPTETKSEQYRAYTKLRPAMQKLTYDVLYSERPTVIGDSDQVIRRIEEMNRAVGIDEFVSFVNFGGMAHELTLKSMELFAERVIPHFRLHHDLDRTDRLSS
jgi:natural product biosynthesis luciferase-like monooxygenase protein